MLYALVESLDELLADGKIVRLDELGSLRVSFSSSGHETKNEVSAKSIKSAKVVYSPGKRIKKMLKALNFKRL